MPISQIVSAVVSGRGRMELITPQDTQPAGPFRHDWPVAMAALPWLDVHAMKTIVVAVDFSNATQGVIEKARTFAESFGAELHLLHVMEPEPSYTAYGFTPNEFPALHAYQDEARRRASDKLKLLAKEAGSGSLKVSAHVVEGSPLRCIADYVKSSGADMLILGSHGHGAIAALLLGSVAEGMVRRALVPTMVVPAPPEG